MSLTPAEASSTPQRVDPPRVSLQSLPAQLVTYHLLPFIAPQNHFITSLDRWATHYVEWRLTHQKTRVSELPGYDATAASQLPGGIWDLREFVFDNPLRIYIVLGSATEMPFSIYRRFCPDTQHKNYAYDICLRRRFQPTQPTQQQCEVVQHPLDRWGTAFVDWLERYGATVVEQLSGWKGAVYKGGGHKVWDEAFRWFFVFGATDDMPFSVYGSFCRRDDDKVLEDYYSMMDFRRWIQERPAHAEGV